MQKQKIKRQYAKTVKKGGAATAKAAAGASQTAAKKAAAFAGRHPAGVIIAIAALLLFIKMCIRDSDTFLLKFILISNPSRRWNRSRPDLFPPGRF